MFQSQNGNVTALPMANTQGLISNGLVLNLDAANPSSYPGSGNI